MRCCGSGPRLLPASCRHQSSSRKSPPRQNALAKALREIGRIERSIFICDWLLDPALRRRAHGNLNKGETRHSLARAVFLHQLGELRDRVAETMAYRACGLNLVVNAIILWNTVYLSRAVRFVPTTSIQKVSSFLSGYYGTKDLGTPSRPCGPGRQTRPPACR